MTWNTSKGVRILMGMEASVFRTAPGHLVDTIRAELDGYGDSSEFGIRVFDALEPWSRLAILADVGQALLGNTTECPSLTNYNEAAIATVFLAMEAIVEIEIDNESDEEETQAYSMRQQLVATMREISSAPDPEDQFLAADVPTFRSREMREWSEVVEKLSDRILWDQDYLTAEVLLDSPRHKAKNVRQSMGISKGYYTAVPPDPTEAERLRILKRLWSLILVSDFKPAS